LTFEPPLFCAEFRTRAQSEVRPLSLARLLLLDNNESNNESFKKPCLQVCLAALENYLFDRLATSSSRLHLRSRGL
jgi:hypothetical protein